MPYIPQERREEVQTKGAEVPGELNYQLTTVITAYMQKRGRNYTTINDILGALEGCKLEFYRRVAATYEDMKIQQNGDVF